LSEINLASLVAGFVQRTCGGQGPAPHRG